MTWDFGATVTPSGAPAQIEFSYAYFDVDLVAGDPLPITWPINTTEVFANIKTQSGVLDVTSWRPADLSNNIIINFVKDNHSPYKIAFNDVSLGSLKGSILTLVWDAANQSLHMR